MASDDETTSAEDTKPCRSAAEQLQAVKKQINEYEALKLGDLKSSLEKFVKDQETKVDDYSKKYADLRNRWDRQQDEIAKLYQDIKRCFPDPLPAALRNCICERRNRLEWLDGKIAVRQKDCHPCDVPVIKARADHEKAKGSLAALMDLVKLLDAALTVNGGKAEDNGKGGLIKSIREQLCKPDRASAFYTFWFVLVKSHRSIQPDKLSDPQKVPALLKDFCKDKTEPAVYETPRASAGGPAAGTGEAKSSAACDAVSAAPLPRLVPPGDYRRLLDCGWECFNDTKKTAATAESVAKQLEDELNGWIAERDAKTTSLDTDIIACLNTLKPAPPCGPMPTVPIAGA
jgi:hypothetical protein